MNAFPRALAATAALWCMAASAAAGGAPASKPATGGGIPADIVNSIVNAALTFKPMDAAGSGQLPVSLQIEPGEWAEIGSAFMNVMEVIRKSGIRRAEYLAKLKAQGVEEEPMSEGGVAYEITVLNNRFAFDRYGYLHFDDRFVKPEERPALQKVEELYRRFHKRLTMKSAKKKPEAIVDRAAEWRVRRVPVFRGFEDDRYQEHDGLIVRFVDEFNRGKATWAGATPAQGKGIAPLTTALVKSHMIEESGGRDAKSLAAWDVDPLQVNVPGDWSDVKSDLGIRKPSKRNEGTPEMNIRAAIRFLVRKGFGVSGQPASKRPTGKFDDWQTALRRYNGRNADKVDGRSYSEIYAEHIVTRAKNPGQFVAIRKKVSK